MTKQEQIKEMARMMCGYCNREEQCIARNDALCDKFNDKNCRYKDDAEKLYDAGYHKIPEGAVVLTKEECEHKVILDEDHFERILNYEREKARKETAKKIERLKAENEKNCLNCIESKRITVDDYSKLQELFAKYRLASEKEIRAQDERIKVFESNMKSLLEIEKDNVRKETAKEILQIISGYTEEGIYLTELKAAIAKYYGVEVGE